MNPSRFCAKICPVFDLWTNFEW